MTRKKVSPSLDPPSTLVSRSHATGVLDLAEETLEDDHDLSIVCELEQVSEYALKEPPEEDPIPHANRHPLLLQSRRQRPLRGYRTLALHWL